MHLRLPGLFLAALTGILSLTVGPSHAQTPSGGSSAGPKGTATQAPKASAQDPAVLGQVEKAFKARFPGIDISAVHATPFPGLYEVQLGMELVYTNTQVDYIMQGSLIDAKARTDLTAARMEKLTAVSFDSLPLAQAIKQVKGNGARKMVVFEDPNCGYCKRLHKTLQEVDNTTVYTLLFPILSPDSEIKARDIWCAKDQTQAWRDWMLDGKVPVEAKCETPIKDLLALGRKMMVQGTPAIIFADGSRVNGALPLDALKEKLDTLN